jgi:integrase
MKFSRVKDYDDLLKFSSTPEGLLDIQKNISRFIEFCKQKGLSYNTIHSYVTGLRHFYEYNDVTLRWKRINAHLPSKGKRIDDRAYTREEIKKMTDIANLRDKAILLVMASSGPRIDAVPSLRIKDLVPTEYNGASIYEIRYYPLSNDEYRGYCTPEAKRTIDDYIRRRKQCGERITENSPVFRKEFNRRDDIEIANAEAITKFSINHIVVELLDRSGVRPRGRMTPEEIQRGINTKRTKAMLTT